MERTEGTVRLFELARAPDRPVHKLQTKSQHQSQRKTNSRTGKDQKEAVWRIWPVWQTGRLYQGQALGALLRRHPRAVLRLKQVLGDLLILVPESGRSILELHRLLHDRRRPRLTGHRCVGPSERLVTLAHQLVDRRVVRRDLLLEPASLVRVLLDAPELVDPLLGSDHVRVAVAILCLRRGELGFGSRQRVVPLGGPANLGDQLPVLTLKRGNLSAEAASVDQRRRPGSSQRRAVPCFERRQQTFDV